jgi:TonB family protein
MNMLKRNLLAALAVCIGLSFGISCPQAPAHPQQRTLTLDHLKNGSYLIPDLACGYTEVKLKSGQGENAGIKVVFGQAVFGSLANDKSLTAVVHLAYHTNELGWLQQLAFVQAKGNKLLQVADYILDDRCTLKSLYIKQGNVWVETATNDSPQKVAEMKLTKIHLSSSKEGCLLEACDFAIDRVSGKLVQAPNMAPYICSVESRVSRQWHPSRVDRGEHVMVTFKIRPTGQIEDLTLQDSSELQSANVAALKAVEEAAPFPPLPAGEPLSMCLDFQANVSVKQ